MKKDKLWVVTPYFNPICYASIKNNLEIFSQRILDQGANLCVVKLEFPSNNNGLSVKKVAPNHIEITTSADSILWHKESLINIAIRILGESKYIAWIDGDVLLPDGWIEQAIEKLQDNDVIQLFKRVYNLKQGETQYKGEYTNFAQSIIWQNKVHKNWLKRRFDRELPFAAPGFAWAAKTEFLKKIDGLYDKAITGSGDVILVDALLNSQDLHVYHAMLTKNMKTDVERYKMNVKSWQPNFSYLPIDIYHLWHGSLQNRQYVDRHKILTKNRYNPKVDLVFDNVRQVYEFKHAYGNLAYDLEKYFIGRRDDENMSSLSLFGGLKRRFINLLLWFIRKLLPPTY